MNKEKIEKAVALYMIGEVCQTAIVYLPKWRFLKRRYMMQLTLDVIEWTLLEFGTKQEYHKYLREALPHFPTLPTYITGIMDDAKNKVRIFGWSKQYKKQLEKLERVINPTD